MYSMQVISVHEHGIHARIRMWIHSLHTQLCGKKCAGDTPARAHIEMHARTHARLRKGLSVPGQEITMLAT